MFIISERNVHGALISGLTLLGEKGYRRDSRNGMVLIAPTQVATTYDKPLERVLRWPIRDANPFFHLYESLWMLAGYNTIAGPARYAKQMTEYSDDGFTMHGAYGFRWRSAFSMNSQWSPTHREGFTDQLAIIASNLIANKDDRRSVLQMWDATNDLGRQGKDLPCNLTATFQINGQGCLDMTVFCRSNDIVWGAYGANAVHFSMLLEYMALWIGVPVGRYTQFSVNYHGYIETVHPLMEELLSRPKPVNPYDEGSQVIEMGPTIEEVNRTIALILKHADSGDMANGHEGPMFDPWGRNVWVMLEAHEAFRQKDNPMRYSNALNILARGDHFCDWIIAGREWLERRAEKAGVTLVLHGGMHGGKQADFYPRSRYGSKL